MIDWDSRMWNERWERLAKLPEASINEKLVALKLRSSESESPGSTAR
jgi:hypothetical protein